MAEPLRFGAEFGVSSQNGNTQNNSSIARLSDGSLVVVWTDAGANAGDVKFQILSPEGEPFRSERTASIGTAGLQGAPKVAAMANGGFVIVWEDFATDASGDIRFRRFDSDGDSFDPTDVTPTAVTSGYQQDPTVAASSSGGFVIGWNEGNTAVTGLGSSTAAMIQESDQFGVLVGSAIRVSGDFGGDFAPQMVYAGTTLQLVWDDDGGPTSTTNGNDGLYSRSILAPLVAGNFADGGSRIDTGVFREASSNPDIAYDATLGRLVVWDDITTGSVGRDIYVDVNGLGPVRVNTTTTNDQSNAQVTSLAFGGFVVVWQDLGGTAGDIRARVYDGAGVATSDDFLVTSVGAATAGAQTAPDVMALLDGRFIVSWTDNVAGGIEAMIFDPRTGPVDYTATGPGNIRFRGTDFEAGDRIVGSTGDDTLDGGAGNDTLIGGAGMDHFTGGLGTDILRGGGNDDIYVITDALDRIIEGATEGQFDQAVAMVNFSLAAGVYVELLSVSDKLAANAAVNLAGNAFSQLISGNAGVNRLEDGLGAADTMSGGAGNDNYIVRTAGTVIIENTGGGTSDAVFASVSYTLAADDDIEVLATTSPTGTTVINLTGNAFAQRITGNAAANRLDSGAGAADTLIGGAGNDAYFVRNAGTLIVENVGGGTRDTVSASVSFRLAADDNIEVLSANPATGTTAINLFGNALGQWLVGNAGANRLDGRGGNDVLSGGLGADVFVFSTPLGAGNIDRIVSYDSTTDQIEIDNAVFTGMIDTNATLAAAAYTFNTTGLATLAAQRIIYQTDTGYLWFDQDGVGGVAAKLFARLEPNLVLGAGEFTVI